MKIQVFNLLTCLLVGVSSAMEFEDDASIQVHHDSSSNVRQVEVANPGYEGDTHDEADQGSLRASTKIDEGEIEFDAPDRRLEDVVVSNTSVADHTVFTTYPPKLPQDATVIRTPPTESNAPLGQYIQERYEGMKFGAPSRFFPADPIGAAGPSSLVAVVNVHIRAQDKYTGRDLWTTSLKSFFGCRGSCFDPKIIYDTHENRFVIVALDSDLRTYSRTHLAVSKDNTPQDASDWYKYSVNSFTNIGGTNTWADYPGLEVDEEAIYVTSNMFSVPPLRFVVSRLWVASKRGLYNGDARSAIVRTANLVSGRNRFGTYMPAEIRDTDWTGAGRGVGTYLVSFGFGGIRIRGSGQNVLSVIIVLDPLGRNPRFTSQLVRIGNVNERLALPNAPQRGDRRNPIETNDNRVLDAVWHRSNLWCVFTVRSGGVAKGYYVKMATRARPNGRVRVAGVLDKGLIRANDIAGTGTYTYYPSIGVNRKGIAVFGFSASSRRTYAGAYVAYRDDIRFRPGGLSRSYVVREGVAPYKRYGSGNRNRWGDYSGIAIDPVDEDCFWLYNKYAAPRTCGSATGSQGREDGCWGTGWAQFCVRPGIRPGSGPQNATQMELVQEPGEVITFEPDDVDFGDDPVDNAMI